MRSLLTATVLLSSVAAFADVYEAPLQLSLCFEHPHYCPEAHADLIVNERTIRAAKGLRHEASGVEYVTGTAVRLDDAFLARDRRGTEYRVRVRPPRELNIVVEVTQVQPGPSRGPASLLGRYRAVQVMLDEVETSPTFGALVLNADGRYKLGSAGGRWEWRDGHVQFEGAIAHWGHAAMRPGGALEFRFERGGIVWSLRFEPSEAAVADRPIARR
jgi:hypothetical protein